jgi:hypothetical protein
LTTFPRRQWFDEAQFESYRQLGYHSAKKAFAGVKADQSRAYQKALDKKRRNEELLPEDERAVAVKLAGDNIESQHFSSEDVLNIFESIYDLSAK